MKKLLKTNHIIRTIICLALALLLIFPQCLCVMADGLEEDDFIEDDYEESDDYDDGYCEDSFGLSVLGGVIVSDGVDDSPFIGESAGLYEEGTEVTIACGEDTAGTAFAGWMSFDVTLTEEEKLSRELRVVMPDYPVTIEAVYFSVPEDNYSLYVATGEISSGRNKGFMNGTYETGETVSVRCEERWCENFSCWEATGIELSNEQKNSESFDLTMPTGHVTLRAVYVEEEYEDDIEDEIDEDIDEGIDEESDDILDEDEVECDEELYIINVFSGNIDGTDEGYGLFEAGTEVTIEAEERTGLSFDRWVEMDGFIELSDNLAESGSLTFEMPDADITMVATYNRAGEPVRYLMSLDGEIATGIYNGEVFGSFYGWDNAGIIQDAYSRLIFDNWDEDDPEGDETGDEENPDDEVLDYDESDFEENLDGEEIVYTPGYMHIAAKTYEGGDYLYRNVASTDSREQGRGSVETGDSENIPLWTVIMMFAISALAGGIVIRLRKSR